MHAPRTKLDPNHSLLKLAETMRAEWRADFASLAAGSKRVSVHRQLDELHRQLARQNRAWWVLGLGIGGLYSAFACYGVLAAFSVI